MLAARPSAKARSTIGLRRSVSKNALSEPGPTGDGLEELLAIAARVPDHRRLAPWRYIVFEGKAREVFGDAALEVQKRETPSASEKMLETTRQALMRAPTVICVVYSPKDCIKGTPEWEQELSTGALCQNLLLAANASGWAGVWLTEWLSYSQGINKLLGLTDKEKVAGYIYLGTATAAPQERMRPDISDHIEHWSA